MNKIVRKTRNFVHNHPALTGYLAGVSVATGAFVALTYDKTLLELTPDALKYLEAGGAVTYVAKGQTLSLVNAAAMHAANA